AVVCAALILLASLLRWLLLQARAGLPAPPDAASQQPWRDCDRGTRPRCKVRPPGVTAIVAHGLAAKSAHRHDPAPGGGTARAGQKGGDEPVRSCCVPLHETPALDQLRGAAGVP